ncbi:SIMPL domain-containing protein [Brevundimonas sp.]|uniref:SIMPL domain-containing protein n=1 Tax=Brevundimonas sp. TaxID=1871086 RepID=UPI0025C22295|nr:SIMPL domain-containing protein [Brevundimonas sp.]
MKTVIAAVAAVLIATPVAAQDIAGPVAAAVDQFGQSMAESMAGGPGVFVTAQGRAPLPDAGALPMTLTIKGEGKTAAEAVADRNAQLDRVRSAANNFDVAIEVGTTTYSISEGTDWTEASAYAGAMDAAAVAEAAAEAAVAVDAAGDAAEEAPPARTVTASVQVKIVRPNETRLPAFVDALVDAGVTDLDDSLNGMNLGQMQPFLSLMGLDTARDPGEAVWNAATADAIIRARYVSVLLRSHDGEDALVSVAVRFGLE